MVMSDKIVMERQASAFAEDFNLHCAILRFILGVQPFDLKIA